MDEQRINWLIEANTSDLRDKVEELEKRIEDLENSKHELRRGMRE